MAFTVRADRETGLRAKRLRGSDLQRPFHGMRTTSPAVLTIEELAWAYQQMMPDHAFFCGVTAAVPRPIRRGIVGHALQVGSDDMRLWHGLRVSTPERHWCDLGAVLSVPDLDWLRWQIVDFRGGDPVQIRLHDYAEQRLVDAAAPLRVAAARVSLNAMTASTSREPFQP